MHSGQSSGAIWKWNMLIGMWIKDGGRTSRSGSGNGGAGGRGPSAPGGTVQGDGKNMEF